MIKKDCGSCALCCKVIEIRETCSDAGVMCGFLDNEQSCSIYSTRPDGCRNFDCAWRLDANAHPSMRPDKCHVVFENLREDIVFGTLDPDYSIDDLILRQINAFVSGGSSVVLQTFEDKPRIYVARGATGSQVWKFIQSKITEYSNDRPELHNKLVNVRPSRV